MVLTHHLLSHCSPHSGRPTWLSTAPLGLGGFALLLGRPGKNGSRLATPGRGGAPPSPIPHSAQEFLTDASDDLEALRFNKRVLASSRKEGGSVWSSSRRRAGPPHHPLHNALAAAGPLDGVGWARMSTGRWRPPALFCVTTAVFVRCTLSSSIGDHLGRLRRRGRKAHLALSGLDVDLTWPCINPAQNASLSVRGRCAHAALCRSAVSGGSQLTRI